MANYQLAKMEQERNIENNAIYQNSSELSNLDTSTKA